MVRIVIVIVLVIVAIIVFHLAPEDATRQLNAIQYALSTRAGFEPAFRNTNILWSKLSTELTGLICETRTPYLCRCAI